jgi:hypothetical protein
VHPATPLVHPKLLVGAPEAQGTRQGYRPTIGQMGKAKQTQWLPHPRVGIGALGAAEGLLWRSRSTAE